MKRPFCLIFCLVSVHLFSQIPVGQWRDHLSYNKTIDVCTDGQIVYAATPFAVFTVDPEDQSMQRMNKINLLSDVGLSSIEFDPATSTLVVGYENGNLDFISNGVPYNLSDIKTSTLVGDKKIYHILPFGEKVYLATGFGIVVLDISKKEVSSTYFIGAEGEQLRVNDLDIRDGIIYASTPDGVRTASISDPFLANFQSWDWLGDLPSTPGEVLDFEIFSDTRFINILNEEVNQLWFKNPENNNWEIWMQDTVKIVNDIWSDSDRLVMALTGSIVAVNQGLEVMVDHLYQSGLAINSESAISFQGDVWFANYVGGLCRRTADNVPFLYQPDGPYHHSLRRISAYNDNFWIAPGGVDASWTNLFHEAPISFMRAENWGYVEMTEGTNTGLSGVRDLMDVAIDPNDNRHIYLGSWEEGLIEIMNEQIVNIFNQHTGAGDNTLQQSNFDFFPEWCGVAGVEFDQDGNVWCTNSWTTKAVHVRTPGGTFNAFDFHPLITSTDKIGDILPARHGLIWAIVSGKGLLVLNTNGTLLSESDDDFKILTDEEGSGGLPTRDVLCIEEDLGGEIWVGTMQGVAIYYNPDCIFSEELCDAEQILIEQDGNIQILLETEAVSVIRIDGGNRKWIGTQNSGVFLFSDDGLTQIHHFTEENSPLLSNSILDITINHESGEVFFGTEKGIVSFLGSATNFDPEISEVQVYPNPVRADFDGVITIDGLDFFTDVKITDMSGKLVSRTVSEGGRAIWDGKSLNGERAVNGMYLVFATRMDGEASQVAKIALLR